MATALKDKWQEAQDSPGITFKDCSLHIGAKLSCSAAASRPGHLPFLSPGGSPDSIATGGLQNKSSPSSLHLALTRHCRKRDFQIITLSEVILLLF